MRMFDLWREIGTAGAFFFLLNLLSTPVMAQVADYTFEQLVTTYTPITGGTVYGTPTADDQRYVDPATPAGGTINTGVGIPIGFNFTYNGVVYDRIGINNNGWISFGTTAEGVNMTTTSAYAPLASTSTITPAHLRNRVSAMGRDLVGGFAFTASGTTGTNTLTGASNTAGVVVGTVITGTGIPTGTTVTAVTATTVTISNNLTSTTTNATYTNQTGNLRVELIGTAPNRQLVIQWSNYKRYSTTGNNDNLNFQIRLYETTNVVEVKYGVIQFGTGTSTGTSAIQVGLGGSAATDFNNRTTTTNWNLSLPGTANNVGMEVNTGVIYPAIGLTFRWTPGSCNSPGAVTFSGAAPTSITASWGSSPSATGYSYEVRTSGAAGSGPVGLVTSGTTAATTVNITGLTANTSYTFYVRSTCGATTSNWTAATFTTPCNPVAAPFTETFDGVTVTSSAYVTPPACWGNFSSAGNYTATTNVWRFANGTGTPGTDPDYGVENVTDHTSGTGMFAWYDGSFGTGVTNVTLESPLIDMSALTTPFVRLWVYSNNTDDAAQNTLNLQVYDGSTWITLAMHTGNAAQWVSLSATVPAGIPSTTKFRIVAQPGTTGGSIFYNDILVDDFSVVDAPTCFAPTDITVTNITPTSATINFTPNSSASYDYEVRTSGTAGSGATGLVASGNVAGSPFTVTGLPPGTTLRLYIRGVCSTTNLSEWSVLVTFTTPCLAENIPWTENFNSTTAGTTPNCWTIVDANGATTWTSVTAPTSPTGFTGVTMRYTYSTTSVANDWLITPGLNLTAGVSYDLSYLLGHNAGTSYMEKVDVWLGTSPTIGAMTTLIHDHDSLTGTTSNNYLWSFTPPSTGVYYIGFHAYSAINQYYIYLDNLSVTPTPICATTTVTKQDDCANNEFSLLVEVTDLGSTTDVDVTYTVDYGTPTTLTGITSSTTLGPFPETSIVDVVVNNGYPSCSAVDLGSFFSSCEIDVDCGSTQPLILEHCYRNNDDRVFVFVGSDPTGTLDLKFLQPSPIATGDGITLWNGYPNTGTQIITPAAGNDLSSLGTITSSGNIISLTIQSNGSESCEDGTLTDNWNIQVRCSGCIEPMGDVLVTTDCADYSFTIGVDLWYLGYSDITGQDLTSADISYTVNGGAPSVIEDVTEGFYSIGTYPVGTVVNITLDHTDGGACSNFLGDFSESAPCPPANDPCTAPASLTVNSTGACPGSAISGTTLYADMTGTAPGCASTGTIQDVWYSFNTGQYISPMTINLTPGTAANVGYQVFTACGTPYTGTGACGASVNGNATVTGLAQNTNYLLRVFTRTDLGEAGTFNVCLSAVHASELCNGAINIPSAPVVNQALACQASNQLNSTTVPATCGAASNSYKGGIEALYTFTPTSTGTYNISISGQTWTSIFVYADACPTAGGTCVASVGTSASSKTLTVTLTAGVTYYIWFDTFPSPASPCPGTFSIVQDLCPTPTAVSINTITNNSANVNWTGGAGTYIIEYGPAATFTTPGTGALPGPGGTVISAATSPTTLTGLLGSTQYRVFIRRDCSATGNGYSANTAGVLFRTGPTATCGAPWFDTGGATANYNNNENWVVTVCPSVPGQVASVSFSAFATEANWDRLHVYDGPSTSSPMFASVNGVGSGSSPYGAGGWWGTTIPGPFTATAANGGCLTFSFWSDGGGTAAGWSAQIDCIVPAPPSCATAPTAPADGSSACVGATTLSWPSVTQATGYDVYLDTGTATTLVSGDQPGTTYNAGTLPPGTYSWRIVPRNALGTATGCPTWTFTRVAIPAVIASNNGPVCAGQDVQLSATSVTNATYSWQGPGGFTSTEQNPLITATTAASAGTYSVIATVSGCPSPSSATYVTVQPAPTNVTATASATEICAGDTIDLAATGTSIGIAFSEDFNAATNAWTIANNSTGGSGGGPTVAAWTLLQSPYTYGTTTFNSNDASQFYMANSDAQGSGGITNTTLTSPAFSLAGLTTTSLQFHHYYRYLGTNDTTQVQVSTNGTSWTTVQTYTSTQGTASGFVQATINLNAYAGQPSVQVRFRYRSAYGWYWAVDNVIVSGQQSPAFSWSSAPAGFTSSEQNPQDVIVNATTTYTVTASSTNGCTTTASVTVNVNDDDQDGDGIVDCVDDCPAIAGEIGDVCNDGDPSTTGDVITADCMCIGTPVGPTTESLTLEVTTDQNGQETSWEIAAQGTDVVMCSGQGLPPNATVTVQCDLPEGCYVLRVFDSGGDGIAGGGYVLRTFPDNKRIIDNAGNFTTGSVSAISGDQGFCLPIGTDRTIYTSCDKLDWVNNQFIVASENAAVSAEWVTGAPNSAQDPTSGYDFWFFDPNGSYSFVRQRRHNQSDGFGNVGATRTAHMQINNWALANHIPTGVLMNVRVRGVVNGDPLEWGPACRFKIDPVAAACPMTKLMDIPGNQFLSCGQYRQWANNSYAHARPVSGATQYQFRFQQPAEGYSVTRTTTSYFVKLFWTDAPPLVTGSQYLVDVRAFKNGQWCPWGDVCTLNIGTPVNGGGEQQSASIEEGASLTMWPNPNRGDQLFLSLSSIDENVLTVTVDLHDLSGKRMMSRTIPTQGGYLNTVMDLEGEIAAGMYLVNITAGDRLYTERLVVQP
jgi:hypothetical protein